MRSFLCSRSSSSSSQFNCQDSIVETQGNKFARFGFNGHNDRDVFMYYLDPVMNIKVISDRISFIITANKWSVRNNIERAVRLCRLKYCSITTLMAAVPETSSNDDLNMFLLH